MKKQLTRKEYREKKAKYGNLDILTDEEFNNLSLYEKGQYERTQLAKGLPMTVEQDTYWDNPENKTSEYKPVSVLHANKNSKYSIAGHLISKFLTVDILLKMLGLSK